MRHISFVKLLELSAALPILAICLACFYKYSFYNALELSWITSQLQISGILLNAIPLFLDLFSGFIIAITFYLYLRPLWTDIKLYLCLLSLLIVMIIATIISGWNKDIIEALLDKSFLFYVFFFITTILVASESVGLSRTIFVCIALASLIYLQSFIDYKSHKEVKKLFYQSSSFSRVFFTEEGKKIIPTSYTSETEEGSTETHDLDWRLLELVGDKAIIIATNRVILDNMEKPQVRIIEYKSIDRIY
ncbi:hypothetical protein MXM33_03550 [Acinetobacter vivianii]|uniref:hypothetical protein n=1 Tax=Acinetobacter vivianii TaxID=1776742 RepID=UPI002DB7F2DA|nr:hypothetical protein [Acinetobacter vivianii]MEB6666107.1 hypothetical protein [Acinetobacter vivianii]